MKIIKQKDFTATITAYTLAQWGACFQAREAFQQFAPKHEPLNDPEAVFITTALCVKYAEKFDFHWALRRLDNHHRLTNSTEVQDALNWYDSEAYKALRVEHREAMRADLPNCASPIWPSLETSEDKEARARLTEVKQRMVEFRNAAMVRIARLFARAFREVEQACFNKNRCFADFQHASDLLRQGRLLRDGAVMPHAMYLRALLGFGYTGKLPDEACGPFTINGHRVWIEAKAPTKKRRGGASHRVKYECRQCLERVPVGRSSQHKCKRHEVNSNG